MPSLYPVFVNFVSVRVRYSANAFTRSSNNNHHKKVVIVSMMQT